MKSSVTQVDQKNSSCFILGDRMPKNNAAYLQQGERKDAREREAHVATAIIPGYQYGFRDLPRCPLSLEDFELLKKTMDFGPRDIQYLQMSYDILEDCIEEIVDAWFNMMLAQPHLAAYFSKVSDGEPQGKIESKYVSRVRHRYSQWILDTARANYDQTWLDYQFEIGRRHGSQKNQTDQVRTPKIVHFRYIPAMIPPMVSALRPFLARTGCSNEEVLAMEQAWLKSMLLQVTLWAQAYIHPDEY